MVIGNRLGLSRVPIPEEWEEIYEMSKKQSLAGIAFAGVERLPQEQMPPGKRIRQWAVKAEKIREHNAKVSEDCRVISRFFEENGFDCVILKGQGNFAYYPEWLQGLRSAGDIDVWCWPKGNANDTQSEIATIRGCATTKRTWIATKTKRPSDYENEDKVQGTKYKVQECKNLLNQRAEASDLNSLNSEASAEVLNQRSALNFESAKRPSLTLGYLGRIEPNKGMTELLEALKKCKAEGRKFKVRFAGKEQMVGEYLPKFEETLGEDFEYCGLVSGETKREFLNSLDVFVMPTYFEGLPMSLLETMSYGVVPVVTKVGSIPTVVKDGENGLFVKVKDMESICEALKKLDEDRALLAKMSLEARKTIQENFSATKYVERLNAIYDSL